MELFALGKKTYYLKNATNIGIYRENDQDVYLIDTGNDKDAGKKILKIVAEKGWQVKGIFTTHSHADHIGGNQVIQDRCQCPVWSWGLEKAFVASPILEPTFLYGGYPFLDLQNKFLMAKKSNVCDFPSSMPKGLEYFPLKGHSLDMVGFKTDDEVYFLGDALFSAETVFKYHFFFLYDVRAFLQTLDFLETLKGGVFLLSHCEITNDLSSLVLLNRKKVQEILDFLYDLCQTPLTFEEILQQVFKVYDLKMNINQYVLVGSTVRSYLAYLLDEKKLNYDFLDCQMKWMQVS